MRGRRGREGERGREGNEDLKKRGDNMERKEGRKVENGVELKRKKQGFPEGEIIFFF